MTSRIQEKIESVIETSLHALGVPEGMVEIHLEHPDDLSHGDYSTNVAFILAKQKGLQDKNPLKLAEKIAIEIRKQKDGSIAEITTAAPGFINFFLSRKFFAESIKEILEKNVYYGKGMNLWNKKIIIEHTNLNPFKPFHIGHIVNNAVGESLSRLLQFQDAKLTRASYGGDVGLHIAKALWGMISIEKEMPTNSINPAEKAAFLGKAYVIGNESYESDEKSKKEIIDYNKKVFEKSDQKINTLYEWGRAASLEYFSDLYKILDSHFDYNFYESEVAERGIELVEDGLKRGIFEKSEGAVIFPGEKFGLHNRVFINSQGLPTYEAKELGLTEKKFSIDDFNQSIVVTATEQNEYFKVVFKAIEEIGASYAGKSLQIGHGFLRLTTGTMASRKGNAILGEAFINEMRTKTKEKMEDSDISEKEKIEISEAVALAAIRYAILRQSLGKDILFDPEQSISLEGDSGPYVQYSYVRAKSVLKKAYVAKIKALASTEDNSSKDSTNLERLLYRFPEVSARAAKEFAPSQIVTYITLVASVFNGWYAGTKIVDTKNATAPYNIALTEAASWVLKNGLWLLGISAPERM